MNLILALTIAGAAPTAVPPAIVAPPTKPQTIQQQFDEASADAAAGNCKIAIPKFQALEGNPRVKAGSLPAATIAVRKAVCQIRLWQTDADEGALRAGLAVLDDAGMDYAVDRAEGWTALGDAAFRRYDYVGAGSIYKKALALKNGEHRLYLLTKMAKATAFDGNAEALSYAEEGVRIASAMPQRDKDTLASFHTLHARTLLNQGNVQPAFKELKTALSLSGGLSNRTTLTEVALRSDLATAAMLVGQKDEARLYLAYTGAGRIEKSPFQSAVSMNPPLCGDETGLRPDDVAIVEFSIDDDGSVVSAHTVYSTGGPTVAAAFGKAVAEWYWDPKDIAAIPPFYRLLTRVELRCSNVLQQGPGMLAPLRDRFHAWAVRRLPDVRADMGDVQLRQTLHRYADESAKSQDHETQIAALGWLAQFDLAPGKALLAMADTALSLTSTTPVPLEVTNWLRIIRLGISQDEKRRKSRDDLNALLALSEDPAIAQDALAADTLRLKAARGWTSASLKDAANLLTTVAQDDRLPAHHPLRQLAWLDLAGKAAAAGNQAQAQEYFSRTGLTDEQCSLLGERPLLKRSNVGSNDYPNEALVMGFEGWVKTEHDITTDGRTANIRPIIAYPAFIFTDAARGMTKGMQFSKSFRSGSPLACSANRHGFQFRIGS